MNYLTAYKDELEKVSKRVFKIISDSSFYEAADIEFSRYDCIYKIFALDMSLKNIVTYIKDDIVYYAIKPTHFTPTYDRDKSSIWKNLLRELGEAFDKKKYLDLKDQFLAIVGEEQLNKILSLRATYEESKDVLDYFFDSEMYKNIQDDLKNIDSNYKAKMKDKYIDLFGVDIEDNGNITLKTKYRIFRHDSFDDITDDDLDKIIYDFFKSQSFDKNLKEFSERMKGRVRKVISAKPSKDLIGTEKQVKWARDIINKFIEQVEDDINYLSDRYDKCKSERGKERTQQELDRKKIVLDYVLKEKSAKYIIEYRNDFVNYMEDIHPKVWEKYRKH